MNAIEMPTRERMQHGRIEALETMQAGVLATIDRRASMLDRYWQDQLLAPEGDLSLARTRYDAGARVAAIYDSAGVRQRLMGVYGPRSHAHEEMTDEQAAAHSAYQGVIRKLTSVSPAVASAVINICIHDFDPVDRRDLIRGLDVLVRHWGLS